MELPKFHFPDMSQITSDASTMFARARQYTEEKLGSAEKTEFSPEFEKLQGRFEAAKKLAEELKSETEVMLQPNPTLRIEEFVYNKLDKAPPLRSNNTEMLGAAMITGGRNLRSTSAGYGELLEKCGAAEVLIGQEERSFYNRVVESFLRPLNGFLENDCKMAQKEKKALSNKRLDLDACKSRARKAKTLESRQEAEKDVRLSQIDFDRQLAIAKGLYEATASAQAKQSVSLKNFIDAQYHYFLTCTKHLEELKHAIDNDLPHPSSVHILADAVKTTVPKTRPKASFWQESSTSPGENCAQARVLFDYDAQNATELALLADEIITVETDSESNGFVMGIRGETRGKVPLNYISILEK